MEVLEAPRPAAGCDASTMNSPRTRRRLQWISLAPFALALIFYAQSRRIEEAARRVDRFTCEQVARGEAGDRRFITLTDVQLGNRGYVAHRDMDAALELYVPIYSSNAAREPRPEEITLLLEILDDHERARLFAPSAPREVTVQADRSIRQIDEGFVHALHERYPGIRIEQCRLLTVGLHEPTVDGARATLHYAGVMLVIAAAVLLAARKLA